MNRSVIALMLLALLSCGEKPAFHPELTDYSEPIDGILPHFRGTRMDPYWSESAELPSDLRRMSEAPLRSDSGRAASGRSFASGKYSLVTFFYTTCNGICPRITQNVKKLSSQIKDQSDLQFLSITIDPTVDNEQTLRSYRAKHSIEQENWSFLTGDKKNIEDLAREEFAAEIQATGKQGLVAFVHTENIFLLDREGFLRGIYRARGEGEFPRIMKELDELRKESKR